MTPRKPNPRRGYRRDLETIDGIVAAQQHGLRVHASGRAYQFTDQDRARGNKTQRDRGRFGHGRFR